MPLPDPREEDVLAIRRRLEQVQERVIRACQRAGRREKEITLVAVTKTFPITTIVAGIEAGIQDFGENKAQELHTKVSGMPAEACRWHMIGHLQRNKAQIAARYAFLFHALDSLRLAHRLARCAEQAGRVLPCLVQVNVSGEMTKFGLAPEAVAGMLDALQAQSYLRIIGLMTLASPAEDPETIRPQCRHLRRILDASPYPEMTVLSMGMSGDFEVAIEEGATHIRVGSAIFGPRISH